MSMPSAFRRAGIVGGSIGTILIGITCLVCNMKILNGLNFVKEKKITDYSSMVEAVFKKSKSGQHRKYAKLARIAINYFLVTASFGYCAVYLLFCSEMAYQVVNSYFPMDYPLFYYQITMGIVFLFISLVTPMRILSIVSYTTAVFTIVSYGFILAYLQYEIVPIENLKLFPDGLDSVLCLGTALFGLFGGMLIVPIISRLKHPEEYRRWDGSHAAAQMALTLVFILVGFFGYVRYGHEAGLLLPLLPRHWFFDLIKSLWFLNVATFYNISTGILIDVFWLPVKKSGRIKGRHLLILSEASFRTLLVALTTILTIFVPCLEQWISLVGSFSASGINLLLPPIIDYIVDINKENRSRFFILKQILNIILFTLGILAATGGTFEAVIEMNNQMNSPKGCYK